MGPWQPFRDITDIVFAAVLALFGWGARRTVKTLDGKLDEVRYIEDQRIIDAAIKRKADQSSIDRQFDGIKEALASNDAKLTMIIQHMIGGSGGVR